MSSISASPIVGAASAIALHTATTISAIAVAMLPIAVPSPAMTPAMNTPTAAPNVPSAPTSTSILTGIRLTAAIAPSSNAKLPAKRLKASETPITIGPISDSPPTAIAKIPIAPPSASSPCPISSSDISLKVFSGETSAFNAAAIMRKDAALASEPFTRVSAMPISINPPPRAAKAAPICSSDIPPRFAIAFERISNPPERIVIATAVERI